MTQSCPFFCFFSAACWVVGPKTRASEVCLLVVWNVMVASTSESGDLDQRRRSDPHRSYLLSQSQQMWSPFSAHRAQSPSTTRRRVHVGVLHQLPNLFLQSLVDGCQTTRKKKNQIVTFLFLCHSCQRKVRPQLVLRVVLDESLMENLWSANTLVGAFVVVFVSTCLYRHFVKQEWHSVERTPPPSPNS